MMLLLLLPCHADAAMPSCCHAATRDICLFFIRQRYALLLRWFRRAYAIIFHAATLCSRYALRRCLPLMLDTLRRRQR